VSRLAAPWLSVRSDDTGSSLRWRTVVVAFAAAIGLVGAAVVGLALASGGGGLARADRALAVLPEDVALLALAEFRPVLEDDELRGVLATLLGAGLGRRLVPPQGSGQPARAGVRGVPCGRRPSAWQETWCRSTQGTSMRFSSA